MEHREMVDLIRGGVPASGGAWAKLGAGTGNFTWALAELLGPAATIYALDRDARAVAAQERRLRDEPPAATILPRQADELRPLGPPTLGCVAAWHCGAAYGLSGDRRAGHKGDSYTRLGKTAEGEDGACV